MTTFLFAVSYGLVCFLAGGLWQYVRTECCPGAHLVTYIESDDDLAPW